MSGPPSPEELRAALAAYPTGVTVVTAPGESGPSGATANAVTSLSLDPPLMLAALDLGSRTLGSVQAAARFGVNVLPAGAEDLAVRFAGKDPEPEKWEGIEWAESEGAPRLGAALAWIACELTGEHEGGDHVILIGRVIAADARAGAPLLFHRGAYRDLLAESD